jgi:hypothetical protein
VNEAAELFLKYDYAETRDLLKTFISLISATLVLSVTFADRILAARTSNRLGRQLLIFCWVLLVAALIASGISLCFIAAAAGAVLYGSLPLINFSYWTFALMSWGFVIIAGLCFIGGLVLMVLATVKSTLRPAVVSPTPKAEEVN